MASTSKQKTTMAKLNRERKLRERRELKQARKEARKEAASAAPVDVTAAMAPEPLDAASDRPVH